MDFVAWVKQHTIPAPRGDRGLGYTVLYAGWLAEVRRCRKRSSERLPNFPSSMDNLVSAGIYFDRWGSGRVPAPGSEGVFDLNPIDLL